MKINNSIWIRDYAPIVTYVYGKRYIAKAIYKPSYMFVYESKPLNSAGKELVEKLKIPYKEIPLVWDGGNVTHNGYGVAVITERLLNDNKQFTKNQILKILKDNLGLSKVIFIKEEPGDITGHIDGMVRFIDRYKIAVGEYPKEYEEGYRFMNEVSEYLKKKLGGRYKIIRIPNEIPEDYEYEGIPSAWGNRVNFLLDGNRIYLPIYGIKKNDDEAIRILKKYKFEVIPLRCDVLSRMGGVLNCVIWQY